MNNYSITISKIIHGGYGLGKMEDGRHAMVRYVAPGEQITFRPIEKKKSYTIGQLKSIEKQSEHRVKPFCRYFGECGGCDLQHVSYPEQLRIKGEIVTDLLNRQIGNSLYSAVLPVIGSPLTENYRQRIRLQVGDNGQSGF